MDSHRLLEDCKALAREAGAAIMDIYGSDDIGLQLKTDSSPLTKADELANRIIEVGLKQVSSYPVISEEGSHDADGDTFWLVDPLDGTKEFIKRNGEFTINIGLVRAGKPILGVVYAPVKRVIYFGAADMGAFKQQDGKKPKRITAEYHAAVPTVVVSRSHLDEKTQKFLDKLGRHRMASMGSSLKLCLVAEGAAALYPRFAPTSLWDTAAADAIVRAADGTVTNPDGNALVYRPDSLRNPFFIACAKGWREKVQPSALFTQT